MIIFFLSLSLNSAWLLYPCRFRSLLLFGMSHGWFFSLRLVKWFISLQWQDRLANPAFPRERMLSATKLSIFLLFPQTFFFFSLFSPPLFSSSRRPACRTQPFLPHPAHLIIYIYARAMMEILKNNFSIRTMILIAQTEFIAIRIHEFHRALFRLKEMD